MSSSTVQHFQAPSGPWAIVVVFAELVPAPGHARWLELPAVLVGLAVPVLLAPARPTAGRPPLQALVLTSRQSSLRGS